MAQVAHLGRQHSAVGPDSHSQHLVGSVGHGGDSTHHWASRVPRGDVSKKGSRPHSLRALPLMNDCPPSPQRKKSLPSRNLHCYSPILRFQQRKPTGKGGLSILTSAWCSVSVLLPEARVPVDTVTECHHLLWGDVAHTRRQVRKGRQKGGSVG